MTATATAPVNGARQGAPSTALAKVEKPTSTALSLEQTFALAEQLVPSGMLPEHIRKAGQAVAIILAGQELGMPPMRALRSLNLVKGKVTENADSQLARFKSDGGRAIWKQLDEKIAVLYLRHPNGDEHTETFTFAGAEKAGLTRPARSGEPSMFTKFPKAMLRSRAITAGLKSIGWEGGAGTYDPSELAIEATATVVSSPAAAGSGTAAEDAVDVEIEAEPELSLEEQLARAKALPFPFQRDQKNGSHGKPIGECDTKLLEGVKKWIVEKQAEKGDEEWHRDILSAIGLVLADRAKDQTQLPLDSTVAATSTPQASPPATSSPTSTEATGSSTTTGKGTELAPGKVSDALDPTSYTATVKRLNALLEDERTPADTAAYWRRQVVNKAPAHELVRGIQAIERIHASAGKPDEKDEIPF